MAAGTWEGRAADALSLLLLRWLVADNHSLGTAEDRLEMGTNTLSWFVYPWTRRGMNVTAMSLKALAKRLGEKGALGWAADRWESELLRVRPKPKRYAPPASWYVTYVGDQPGNGLVGALRDRILQLNGERVSRGEPELTLEDVAQMMRVHPATCRQWLGILTSQPLRKPREYQIPGVARFLIGSEATEEAWDEEMVRVWAMLGAPSPHAAGRFLLRRLWVKGHTTTRLRSTLDQRVVTRVLWEGVATLRTQQRLIETLDLAGAQAVQLRYLVQEPSKRDERIRLTHFSVAICKRRGRRKGGDKRGRSRREATRAVMQQAIERIRARGDEPTFENTWKETAKVNGRGVSRPTVAKWLPVILTDGA